jgi:hypothetical protein
MKKRIEQLETNVIGAIEANGNKIVETQMAGIQSIKEQVKK